MPDRVLELTNKDSLYYLRFMGRFKEGLVTLLSEYTTKEKLDKNIEVALMDKVSNIYSAVRVKVILPPELIIDIYQTKYKQDMTHADRRLLINYQNTPTISFVYGELQSNCGLCYISVLSLKTQLRGVNIGNYVLNFVETFSYDSLDYTAIYCSTTNKNLHFCKLLLERSWENVGINFKNNNGGNFILLWQKILREGTVTLPQITKSNIMEILG